MFEERNKRKLGKNGEYGEISSEMKESQNKRKENEFGNKEETK